MARQDFWLNLPVKNIPDSKRFFASVGMKIGDGPGNTATSAPLVVGSNGTVVMLFEEPTFRTFVNQPICDSGIYCEVLLSISVESKEEVDAIALKAQEAGGQTHHQPKEMEGNIYACVFSDVDGHKWNVVYLK